MLLKSCQTEKKVKAAGNTQKRSAGSNMRLTNTLQTGQRIQRKVVRTLAPKRTHRGVKEEPTVDPTCDNSNDSGLGFEQHHEHNAALRVADPDAGWPGERLGLGRVPDWAGSRQGWPTECSEAKRKRLEIKIESDDANDDFSFPDSVRQTTQLLLHSSPVERMSAPRPVKRPGLIAQRRSQTTLISTQLLSKPTRGRVPGPQANRNILASHLLGLATKGRGKVVPSPATNQTGAVSRDGKTQLSIVCQPEQQHRARYQTEGSRGAVKDRTGSSFPQVQLTGWLGPATLEVYIGSDCGKVVPHMFYQACRVSGKNSTQCQERTEEGTVVIEVQFEPAKDMIVTCDCVGILKERNVDVEHRFPDQSGSRNKKKSTRCRMVFRTILAHPDGSQETLQICSQPIACTQPPGVPEICKKSRTSSPACGGQELFILGKNFLKDTRVLLCNPDLQPPWEAYVTPDKEYLQQSHLVCVVPPYHDPHMVEPVVVRLTVVSSGKSSEAHVFTYTPQLPVGATVKERHASQAEQSGSSPLSESSTTFQPPEVVSATSIATHKSTPTVEPTLQFLPAEPKKERVFPVIMWKSSVSSEDVSKSMTLSAESEDLLLEPPALHPLPRRPSVSDKNLAAQLKGMDLRTKLGAMAEVTLKAKPSMATGADLSSTLPPSMATLRRFVANDNGSPLPSLSVENFLSRLECKPDDCLGPTGDNKPGSKVPTALQLAFPLSQEASVLKAGLRLPDQLKLKDLVVLATRERIVNSTNPQCSPHFRGDAAPPQMVTSTSSEKEGIIAETSEIATLTKFGNKCSTGVHCMAITGKDMLGQTQTSLPFNNYVPENGSTASLLSPPIENKGTGMMMSLQEPVFEGHSRVDPTPCNGMFAGHVLMSASGLRSEGGLPSSKGGAELCSSSNVGTYCTSPTASGKSMLFQVSDSSPLHTYLGKTSLSPPGTRKDSAKDQSLFEGHVTDSSSLLAKEAATMLHMQDVAPVDRYMGDSPLLLSSLPSNSMIADSNASKPYDFVKPDGSSPIAHMSHSVSPLLYSSMGNQSSRSPPINSSKVFASGSPPPSNQGDGNSLSLAGVPDYGPSVSAMAQGAVSSSLGDLHPLRCVSVDTRSLEPGLTQALKDSMLPTSQVQSSTVSPDMICGPGPMGVEHGVAVNISPMDMSNLILDPSASVDTKTNMGNLCTPSIAMKSLILGSDGTVPSSTGMKDMLLSSVTPRASQMAMKNMMLRVDVDDQLLSQPGAITPETVRLDALVNSTLDRHIDAAQVPPASSSSLLYPLPVLAHSGLLQQVTRAAGTVQYNPSTDVSSSLEPTSMGYAMLSTNTQFADFPPPSSIPHDLSPVSQASCVNKTPESSVQKEGECPRRVECPDGVTVRERREEGMVPQELTQMSDHDLISYINPSCFDQV